MPNIFRYLYAVHYWLNQGGGGEDSSNSLPPPHAAKFKTKDFEDTKISKFWRDLIFVA